MLKGRNHIVKGKQYRRITDDKPQIVLIAPVEKIIGGNIKIEMPKEICDKEYSVKGRYGPNNGGYQPGSFFILKGCII
jgi:hypothetical protein